VSDANMQPYATIPQSLNVCVCVCVLSPSRPQTKWLCLQFELESIHYFADRRYCG